jgi:TRAP-type C4-dicarboxylate transport system substrate-binding protein
MKLNKRILITIVLMAIIVLVTPLIASCTQTAAPSTSAPSSTTKPDSGKVYKWRAQTYATREEGEQIGFERAADAIREASNGRLDVTWYYAGELIPTAETFEACSNGTIEVCNTLTGYHFGFMPEAAVLMGLPGIVRTRADAMHMAYDKDWRFWDKLVDAYREYDLEMVCPTSFSPQPTTGGFGIASTVPIRKLDDFKGVKIRSFGTLAAWIGLTGASMVNLDASELYTSLALGTIDATTWSGPGSLWRMKIQEQTKYYINTGMRTFLVGLLAVNEKAWESLPDDLKEIMKSYHWQEATIYTMTEDLAGEIALEKMKKDWGIEEITLPEEDMAKWYKMGESIWATYAAKNARAKEWIDIQKEWMKWRGYL